MSDLGCFVLSKTQTRQDDCSVHTEGLDFIYSHMCD